MRAPLRFPSDFVFGAATSAYQVEGHIENDWSAWERQGRLHDRTARNGRGCEHWERFEADLGLLGQLGAQAYRLSLEWARLEPRRGVWDDAAWEGYRRRLEALVKAGLRPVVTLHHFTHPPWFHDDTPWHERGCLDAWRRYVRRCGELLAGLDAAVISINEPMVFLLAGYVAGAFPPGRRSATEAFHALENLVRAHVVVKEELAPSALGIAQNMLVFTADRAWHPVDQALSRLVHDTYNHAFLEALTTGTLVASLPGVVSGKRFIDGAQGSMSFVGMNYYSRAHLRFVTQAPFVEYHFRDPKGRGLTDLKWEYFPEGFGQLLRQLTRYQKPIWVTENGLDDRLGTRRSRFLHDHWKELILARADGAPVEAYFHWSLMDNFEWLEAWGPRFGLFRVDFETLERTPTPAVDYFRQVATGRVLVEPP